MPKKPAKNAFFYFMVDFRNKQEDLGHEFPNGLADVSVEASPVWNNMTVQEKQPYEKQAKEAKSAGTATPIAKAERYTSQGVAFSEVERVQLKEKQAQAQMQDEIHQIINDSYRNNTISTQEYVFVAANYFCKTISNVFVPAELALVKYNLAEGFGSTYHSCINPVCLPQGYAFEAQEMSQKVHRLPTPPNALGECNYLTILNGVLEFLGTNNLEKHPPLFTNSNQVSAVKSILQQLCIEANKDPKCFRVYPLAELLFVLKGATSKYGLDELCAFQSIHIAQAMIDRDQYDYRTNVACMFHQDTDVIKYCSLSEVIRWSFTFSDHMCLDLGIDLIPGRHVPVDSDIMIGCRLRDELEETQSMISSLGLTDNASITTSKTNYTKPCNFIDDDNVSLNSEISFTSTIKSEKQTDDLNEDDSGNPWFSRNNTMARAPLDDSLVFPIGSKSGAIISGRGRGRGVLVDESLSLSRRIFGRGKC